VVLRFVFFFGVVTSHSVSSSSSSTFDLRLFLLGVRLGRMAFSRVASLWLQSAHAQFQHCIFTYPSPISVRHISCLERLFHPILALLIKAGKALQLLHITIAMKCSCNIFGLRTAPELVSGRIHTIFVRFVLTNACISKSNDLRNPPNKQTSLLPL